MPRVTAYIGEKRALAIYQVMAIAMYILIWRLKNLIVVSALAALAGLVAGVRFMSLIG